jgi:tryptophan-rich sensory protein
MTTALQNLRRAADPGGWRRRLADIAVVAVPVVVGGIGGIFTAGAIPTWYRTLDKPSWNPPDVVFGPVWTTLYVLMGIALLQIWRMDRSRPEVRLALAVFATQLALNFAWSWIFFERKEVGLAFAEIVALHASIVATIWAFGRLSPKAALLLVPYLGWVSFAAILNAEIWRLNS